MAAPRACGMSLERLDIQCEIKAADDAEGAEQGVFTGYGSVFGNLDQGRDIVMPGAFKSAKASKVKLLWQHDARQPIGVYDELEEDAKGLRLKGRLCLDTVKGREAYALMKMGALDGLSIGFRMGAKDFDYDSAKDIRSIKRAELLEVSIVTFPMNTRALVGGVKSAECKRDLEHALRDAGFSVSEAKYVAGLTSLPAIRPIEAPTEEPQHQQHSDPSATPGGEGDASINLEPFLRELRDARKALQWPT